MVNLPENLKISLNQNLLGLLVCFGFLGAAEYYKLHILLWFSIFPSIAMVLSIIFTTTSYTKNYMNNKETNKSENNEVKGQKMNHRTILLSLTIVGAIGLFIFHQQFPNYANLTSWKYSLIKVIEIAVTAIFTTTLMAFLLFKNEK